MLTKKHYKAIAEIMRKATGNEGGSTDPDVVETSNMICGLYAKKLADYFAADNPQFDRARFLEACGL